MNGPGTYCDTSVVLKLIFSEPLSETAREFVQLRGAAVLYTRLTELETENTLHAKRHRREITPRQLRACRLLIDSLLDDGHFVRPDVTLDSIAVESLLLVPSVTTATGCRTLDLLHIAAARLLKCGEFVTCDQRQCAAASASGLRGIDLGRWSL